MGYDGFLGPDPVSDSPSVHRFLAPLAFVAAVACSRSVATGQDAGGVCITLFGHPNAQTGLSATQCGPTCGCGATLYVAPDYSDSFINSLVTDWTLQTPYPPLSADPYASPAPPADPPDAVCGVLPLRAGDAGPRPYVLVNYASEADADTAGAIPTNFGHCGLCSTLWNLAVYMRVNDLTAPVRACGFNSSTADENVACLQALGFDLPCAQIYYFNTVHTRSVCLSPCLSALSQPYNLPDGGLNGCLQCDEEQSGPVFQGVAGRTRRNSGLANAICRPCSEVRPLLHDY
jgi:hypothetical protein